MLLWPHRETCDDPYLLLVPITFSGKINRQQPFSLTSQHVSRSEGKRSSYGRTFSASSLCHSSRENPSSQMRFRQRASLARSVRCQGTEYLRWVSPCEKLPLLRE